ncbi:MAG: hypothetical protein IKG39_09100 [Lachnospiraceae bacterium]|nr:hypothetical protein [Lachnospiraceae bacterium]
MKKSIFKNHIGELVAAIVIGLLEVLALSLFYKDSLAFWFASFGNVLLLIGAWIVFSALFFVLFRLFLFLMDRLVPAKKQGRKHFWFALLILLIFWLPWLIAFYPGSASYDMMYQVTQINGGILLNGHHPPFATMVMGLVSNIGWMISHGPNLGIFLYILLQTLICAVAVAYMIAQMQRIGVSTAFQMIVLGYFAIVPLWGGAMQTGIKDILFTGVFLLFMTFSMQLFLPLQKADGTVRFPAWKWILYGICIVVLCLYRNGIILILIPTLVIFFFCGDKSRGWRKYFVLTAAVSLALVLIFGNVVQRVYHTKTETAEALSIPFQQTARDIRDHAEELTPQQQEIIEKTFNIEDYRKLGKAYYRYASDPVKVHYLWWAAEEQSVMLKEYLKVWGQRLGKRPMTYIEATLSNTFGYYTITPKITPEKYGAGTMVQFGVDTLASEDAVKASEGRLDASYIPHQAEKMQGFAAVLTKWHGLWQKIPVLNLLLKCGTYGLILLIITVHFAKKKNKRVLLAIPLILLYLMAMASPLNEHIRYVLPAVASLPLVIAACYGREEKQSLEE